MIYRTLNWLSRLRDKSKIAYYQKYINGSGFRLNYDVAMMCPQNIYIGKNTYINGGMIYASPNAKITIGNNCLISYAVHIRTDMHKYKDKKVPINKQGLIEKNINIGNDVWIGYGVQIMPGINIADGCVIGAGAIVTKDTDPYGIYVGVPAKKIGTRE